jgi:FtsH-binding integral membrane protein
MYTTGYDLTRDRETESAALLSRVCFLTIAAVICTALGSSVLWVFPSTGLWMVGLIGSFAMLFVCNAVARKFPINLACLAAFAFLEGLAITPILMRYAKLDNGPLVIIQAAALSVIIFAMVGTLGYTSTKSYAHWLPWMLGGLFALILVGLLFWFVTASPAMYWLYSAGGTLLFIGFVFVDFNRIRHKFGADDYIPATMEVYLDLINLFLFILRLLGGSRRN